MTPFNYSIWLVPCAEQREALQRTIDILAARFKAPSFSPHVTLCSGVWKMSEPELTKAVERVGTLLRSVRGPLGERSLPMTVSGIDWTDHWATFFFLRLSGADDVLERAAFLVAGSHSPAVGPHLSLLYGMNMPETDRSVLRQELAGHLPAEFRFDSLELIRPVSGRWENVERWSCLHTARLH